MPMKVVEKHVNYLQNLQLYTYVYPTYVVG